MIRLYRLIKKKIYTHIIEPIIQSVSPVNEAALGSAIGMFFGMTPTVGIQMWLVFMTWLFCKYVLDVRFDLVIGTALVWISNPLTMFFLYYGFLITGYEFYSLLGVDVNVLSYTTFNDQLGEIVNMPGAGKWEVVLAAGRFLLYDLGVPMIVGCLFYAIPLSFISFFGTRKLLHQYRKRTASKMGIDYETWRDKYERKCDE